MRLTIEDKVVAALFGVLVMGLLYGLHVVIMDGLPSSPAEYAEIRQLIKGDNVKESLFATFLKDGVLSRREYETIKGMR